MAVHEKNCQLSTFATSVLPVLLTLSRTCCPSLSPVRTNSCALPSASNTVNFIFSAINRRNTRAMKRLLDLQRVHFPNAVWPVFQAREGKKFFLYTTKTCSWQFVLAQPIRERRIKRRVTKQQNLLDRIYPWTWPYHKPEINFQHYVTQSLEQATSKNGIN